MSFQDLSSESLSELSRRELQALAKEHGVKANQKSSKIIEALLQIQSDVSETMPGVEQVEVSPTVSSPVTEVSSPVTAAAEPAAVETTEVEAEAEAEPAAEPAAVETTESEATEVEVVAETMDVKEEETTNTTEKVEEPKTEKKEEKSVQPASAPTLDVAATADPKPAAPPAPPTAAKAPTRKRRALGSLSVNKHTTPSESAKKKTKTGLPRPGAISKHHANKFSKIHAKLFDKEEDLKDHVKRVEGRKKALVKGKGTPTNSRPQPASTMSDRPKSKSKATLRPPHIRPQSAVKPRPKFDLAASLRRPVSWKLKTGTVKPLEE